MTGMRLWGAGGLFRAEHMRKSTKVVAGFAVLGFTMPLQFWVYQSVAKSNGYLLTYLCPSSILSVVLWVDGPRPLFEGVVVWFLICLSNALLYAAPALAVVVIYRVIRPDSQPSGLWLQ
jgi:hypothetical protein